MPSCINLHKFLFSIKCMMGIPSLPLPCPHPHTNMHTVYCPYPTAPLVSANASAELPLHSWQMALSLKHTKPSHTHSVLWHGPHRAGAGAIWRPGRRNEAPPVAHVSDWASNWLSCRLFPPVPTPPTSIRHPYLISITMGRHRVKSWPHPPLYPLHYPLPPSPLLLFFLRTPHVFSPFLSVPHFHVVIRAVLDVFQSLPPFLFLHNHHPSRNFSPVALISRVSSCVSLSFYHLSFFFFLEHSGIL